MNREMLVDFDRDVDWPRHGLQRITQVIRRTVRG